MSAEWPDDDPVWDDNPGSNEVEIVLVGGYSQKLTVTDDELGWISDAIEHNGIIRCESFNGWINASNVLMVRFLEDEK